MIVDFGSKERLTDREWCDQVIVDNSPYSHQNVDNFSCDQKLLFSDGWRAVSQGHSLVVYVKFGIMILRVYHRQDVTKGAFKIAESFVVVAELIVQGYPGDKLWFAGADAVQPLSKP